MVGLCAAAALLVVFVGATAGKVQSASAWRQFADGLGQFGVPRPARQTVAAAVVTGEIAVVALLMIPVAPMPVRLIPAIALLAGFTVAVAVAGARHPRLACHCFGSSGPTRVGPHLIINFALIVLGVAGVVVRDGVSRSAGTSVLAAGLGFIAGALALSAVPILEALGPRSLRSVPGRIGRR